MKLPKLSTPIQVLLAIVLGLIVGLMTSPESNWFGIPLAQLYELMRDLFLNALKLIIVPLVASSIIVSVSSMNQGQSVGRLGAKTFATFAITTTLAVLVGWLLVTFLQPGSVEQPEAVTLSKTVKELAQLNNNTGFGKFRELFLRIIPSNIIEAAGKANMLAVILFALLFGFSMTQIENQAAAATLRSFFSGVLQVIMRITHLIMKALPFGVFGMIAHITATTGWAAIQNAGYFFSL